MDDKKVELKDLDIFALLRLEHLSPEEKAQRIAEIQEIALTSFFQDDLPQFLSEEEMQSFEALAQNIEKSAETEQFLRSKVPDLDELMFGKMLYVKKEIVKQNMQTRLEINNKETSEPESQNDSVKMQELNAEKEKLEKIISAIDEDDWSQASEMISTL
jgi:hypothetical protein